MMTRLSTRRLLRAATVAVLLAVAAVWWLDLPYTPVEKVPALHGMAESAAFERYGKPDVTEEFTMAERLQEFQVGLYNTYPSYARYKLTIWVHEQDDAWLVLDTCRYQNGVMF